MGPAVAGIGGKRERQGGGGGGSGRNRRQSEEDLAGEGFAKRREVRITGICRNVT